MRRFKRRILVTIVAAASLAAAPSAMASGTRTDRICQTTSGVYQVCLSGVSSYNGKAATGYVSGVSCITLPPGEFGGYSCGKLVPQGRSWGAYWNSHLGAWEEWLNQAVDYVSPLVTYPVFDTSCVYLRIDVRPSGVTTYQNFSEKNLPYLTQC